MKNQIHTLTAVFVVAFVVLMVGAVDSATAADQWFVLGQQTLKSADPSAEIKCQGGRAKEDVKQAKISVEGADVDISKVVLHWNNRPDETVWNVGTVKAGGQTAAKSAPGHEGTLGSVTVNYKILGSATTAKIKVWGYD